MKAHGLMAEYTSPEAFTAGLRAVRAEGYERLDAYLPCEVEEALELIPHRRTPIAAIMACGGATGGIFGFLLQWYASVDYPWNVGGRPILSWPSFIPITFELTVLTSAFCGLFGFFWLARFPRLDHPVFSDPRFHRASQDRFFLCIRSDDPLYEPERTLELLRRSPAESVREVPA